MSARLCRSTTLHLPTTAHLHHSNLFIVRIFNGASAPDFVSDENKKVIYSSLKKNVKNIVEILNSYEKDKNLIKSVYIDAGSMIADMLLWEDADLDLFAKELGADKFINQIKIIKSQNQKELEAKKKKEEEQRKKDEEEEEKKWKKRKDKISERLKKIAEAFENGYFKYTMKLPFDKDISQEEIAQLPREDEGVKAMIRALVNAQTKITKPEQLKVFDGMLFYMRSHVPAKTCLLKVNLPGMLSIVGLSKDDLKAPGKSAQAISHYKEVVRIINTYPMVFKAGFGVLMDNNPHDYDVSISEYSSGIDLGLRKAAKKLEKQARKTKGLRRGAKEALAKVLVKVANRHKGFNDKVSDIVYGEKKR